MTNEFQNKILAVFASLQNLYKREEDKDIDMLPAWTLSDDTLTDDFTAMLYAMHIFYQTITKDDGDIFNFVSILNRLAIQHEFMEDDK